MTAKQSTVAPTPTETLAISVARSSLVATPPDQIPDTDLGLIAYLITALRRALNKRYDAIRLHLIGRAAVDGQRSDNGRVFLHVGDWEIRFSTSRERVVTERVVAALASAAPEWRRRVVRQREAGEAVCQRCGGSGRISTPATTEIDEEALRAAIDAGAVRYEDVYEATYTLGQIRPPAAVAGRLRALVAGVAEEDAR